MLAVAGFSVVARFAPHPANFAPVGALALFAGMQTGRVSRWALLLPLGVMAASDIFIGLYDWRIMAAVYAGVACYGAIGYAVRNAKSVAAPLLSSVAASTLFYLVTNAAVWAFSPLYEKTSAGLSLAYFMGLPFFKNTLLGDLFYAGVFIGGYAILTSMVFRADFAREKTQ